MSETFHFKKYINIRLEIHSLYSLLKHNFYNVLIPDQKYLKYYNSEIVNTAMEY
jgi:hypothetical protein